MRTRSRLTKGLSERSIRSQEEDTLQAKLKGRTADVSMGNELRMSLSLSDSPLDSRITDKQMIDNNP